MEIILASERHISNLPKIGSVTFTSPLLLNSDPTEDFHAATKQYVDSKFTGLDISQFTTGRLPYSVMPAITGDATSPQGEWVITLTNTGVVPGTYSRYKVNSTGRIVEGSQLRSEDLPDLDWSKIIAGKPNSLAGYGVSNAIRTDADETAISISTAATPTLESHAATLGYLKTKPKPEAGETTAIGEYRFVSDVTASSLSDDFLRANGSQVNIDDYQPLFDLVGHRFSIVNVTKGFGRPWMNVGDVVTDPLSALFTEEATLPVALSNHTLVVTKNTVYVIGGTTADGNYTEKTYYATISDGSIGAWTEGLSLDICISESRSVVIGNKVYVYPSYSSSTVDKAGTKGFANYIVVGTFNSSGIITSWDISYKEKPMLSHVGAETIVFGKWFFVMGGEGIGGEGFNGQTAKIYRAPINGDYSLGNFVEAGTLSEPVSYGRAMVNDKAVTLVRAVNKIGENSSYTRFYTCFISTSDGSISMEAYGSFENYQISPDYYRSKGSVLVVADRVYDIPGKTSLGYEDVPVGDFYTCNITFRDSSVGDNGGIVGAYVDTTYNGTHDKLYNSELLFTGSKIYLIGGNYTASEAVTDKIFSVPISSADTVTMTPVTNIDHSQYHKQGTLAEDGKFLLPDLSSHELPNGDYYVRAK